MSIRPFKLPEDMDLMNSLVMEGFQYPENPSWNIQEDEVQGMIDRINGAKRIWPLLGFMRLFVPLFRDILCGFIDEEERKPAGLINFMRQRNVPEWYIANVTVLPAYRRRGIARKLVEATLQELRRRKARVAFLDVVVGNDPAFYLYKDMGFEEFTQSSEYDLQPDIAIHSMPLPAGYTRKPLSPYDWKTRFEFARRVTPAHVTRFEPVTEERYRVSWLLPFIGGLLESAGGSRNGRIMIHGPEGEVAAIGQYSYRTRPGGTNFVKLSIDPGHPGLANPLLHHVFSEVQRLSPGRRVNTGFEDWESALIGCAEEMGCKKRFGAHRMGLRF